MLCWLVILGVYMGWVDVVYGKPAEKQLTATDWQYPEIPECYLRPQFIPVEMPDKDTPEKCDKYIRFMQQAKP